MNNVDVLVASGQNRVPFESLLAGISVGKRLLNYNKNQTVFAQGDEAEAVYYLQQGQVRLTVVSFSGKEATLSILGPQDFFLGRLFGSSATASQYRFHVGTFGPHPNRKTRPAARSPRQSAAV